MSETSRAQALPDLLRQAALIAEHDVDAALFREAAQRIETLETALRGVRSPSRGDLCWCDYSRDIVGHGHQTKCIAACAALAGEAKRGAS